LGKLCVVVVLQYRNGNEIMNKKTDNRGLSLVELIVTIAVMSVLVGILVPRFQEYINSRRQQACRANREALLNIYEKAVYDDQLLVAQADLQMIIDASGSKMTTEYTNQAKDYLICPDAKETGHYSAHVTDNVAYITCDCHSDDVCTLAFDNWVAKADLADPSIDLDPSYTIPAHSGPESEGAGDPEEEEVPPADTTETVNTGIWPRVMDSQGRLDERWAAVGAQPGNTVTINAPVYFKDITGAEIVIVKGPYSVKYEDANYPLGHGANALPYVIATSGVKYTGGNLPAQIEVQEQGHYEYTTHYDTVTYKGVTKHVKKYVLKDCGRVNCSKRYSQRHSHRWSGWGAYWDFGPENGADKEDCWHYSFDCGIEGCPNRNKTGDHKHEGGYYDYEEKWVDETTGLDCGVEGCPDRNKNNHSHQVANGEDKTWVAGDTKDVYRVNYGDMLELNGVTYIYTVNSGDKNYVEGLPTAEQTALGTDYKGWYVVPTPIK